jgi:hypothetical protein
MSNSGRRSANLLAVGLRTAVRAQLARTARCHAIATETTRTWHHAEAQALRRGEARINQLQLHLQDNWQVTDKLLVNAGFKTSARWASGWFPIQPKGGSLSGLAA